jgi:hypothetical protein
MNKNFAKRVEAAPNNDWHAMGGDEIWLPYTQMKNALTPLIAAHTAGSRIVVDGMPRLQSPPYSECDARTDCAHAACDVRWT